MDAPTLAARARLRSSRRKCLSAGSEDRVQAKPIPECLDEGHFEGRLKVYTNGQCSYPVIAGPSNDKLDVEEYPVRI